MPDTKRDMEAKPGKKPAKDKSVHSGHSGLTYINFFLAVIALVGLVGIILDPGYLVPDGMKGQLGGVVQRSAHNAMALREAEARLAKLEQGDGTREMLLEALTLEVTHKLEYLVQQPLDPQRKAALEQALEALKATP